MDSPDCLPPVPTGRCFAVPLFPKITRYDLHVVRIVHIERAQRGLVKRFGRFLVGVRLRLSGAVIAQEIINILNLLVFICLRFVGGFASVVDGFGLFGSRLIVGRDHFLDKIVVNPGRGSSVSRS
ncbi:MAG: hypothetical protein M2R45_01569 [Verrucomicrobia subdivision 3 bacterium]|nr:hypothetical protein [Limisphaerales bacterium]